MDHAGWISLIQPWSVSSTQAPVTWMCAPAPVGPNIHANAAGYQVMAQGWFKAITRARSAAASSSHRFGFGLGH